MGKKTELKKENRWGYLCCLLNEAGGEIYQYQRFITGVYALSNSIDRKDDEQIFDYGFRDLALFGPADKRLSKDITAIQWCELIDIERAQRKDDRTTHSLIKLTEWGKKHVQSYLCDLSVSQIKRLKEVAKDLKSDVKAADLLVKYGPKWSEKGVGILNTSFLPEEDTQAFFLSIDKL